MMEGAGLSNLFFYFEGIFWYSLTIEYLKIVPNVIYTIETSLGLSLAIRHTDSWPRPLVWSVIPVTHGGGGGVSIFHVVGQYVILEDSHTIQSPQTT